MTMVARQTGAPAPSPQSRAAALPYPDRFYVAAVFVGFSAASSQATSKSLSSKFSDDSLLLLYSLYQQATVGPCNVAKPWSWNAVEYAKWTSWNQLGKMPSPEAMRLFVRTLEEEDPDWFRKAQEEEEASGDQNEAEWWANAHNEEMPAAHDVPALAGKQKLNMEEKGEPDFEQSDNAAPVLASANGTVPLIGHQETGEQEIVIEEPDLAEKDKLHMEEKGEPNFEQSDNTSANGPVLASANGRVPLTGHLETGEQEVVPKIYNSWTSPTILGPRPAARYQHAAAIVGRKMFVIGGNYNGRYLSDVHELNLDTFIWSKVDTFTWSKVEQKSPFPPCAGHSLVHWNDKLLVVGGHSKESSNSVTVRALEPASSSWSTLSTFGQSPVARGGQTVTRLGNTLVMFGGEDSKRRLYNDINVFDLETMTWDVIKAGGTLPPPRSDHAAALHDDRYLFVFGGGSHSSCFNDLHVLDCETMQWSQPPQQGFLPSPRAGHAGVAVGDNWFIMGGGDNKSGIPDTLVLNMSSLVWHRVATEERRTSIASEGLSVISAFADGAESLVSFGGYNGRYSNEVHVFRIGLVEKPSHKVLHSPAAAAAAASAAAAFAISQSQASTSTPSPFGNTVIEQRETILSESWGKGLQELKPKESELQNNGNHSSSDGILEQVGATVDETPNVTAHLEAQLKLPTLEASKVKDELSSSDGIAGQVGATVDQIPDGTAQLESQLELAALETIKVRQAKLEVELATLEASKAKQAQMEAQIELITLEASKVKQELANVVQEKFDLEKELAAVRGQLAAEQSRCFMLEVDVAELRQKLQEMGSLQKELDQARHQREVAEEAVVNALQKPSAGVWGWLAGYQGDQKSVE